jgi:protocatechuate 3,4-dioxygenase beta subunit
MRMPAAVTVFVLALAVSVGVSAEAAAQAPTRDWRRPKPQTGTASVRGHVVDGVTGQPLARAQVRISGMGHNTTVITDAAGLFAFTGLAAGRYSFWVTKPTYLNTAFPELGQTLRSLRGVDVADGQTIDSVTVRLYHGGALTGRVVDPYGDPVENVSIQARRVSRPGVGGGRLSGGGPTYTSNDAGEFRVGRLEAGAYVLIAMPHGPPSEGSETAALVPTYYPGVLSSEQAQPITIERGQTIGGLDFAVLEQPVTTITGTVLDSRGQPASAGNVNVQSLSGGPNNWRGGNSLQPDGTFELKLPPGDYQLTAYVTDRQTEAMRNAGPNRQPPMGMTRIAVTTDPLSNIVITTGDGATISGRVVFDGDGTPPDPARLTVSARSMRTLFPFGAPGRNDFDLTADCRADGTTPVKPDLTFTLEGAQGTCLVNVASEGGLWRMKSVTYQSTDLLDRPLDLQGNQQVRGVQVVLTNRRTTLTADVTDDHGAQSQDHVLVAFSADRARWSNPRYTAFTVRSSNVATRANTTAPAAVAPPPSGRDAVASFAFGPASALQTGATRANNLSTLPPGDYYVIALDDATFDDVRDPAFFELIAPSATRVTLREGEEQSVQLRRIKAPAAAAQ